MKKKKKLKKVVRDQQGIIAIQEDSIVKLHQLLQDEVRKSAEDNKTNRQIISELEDELQKMKAKEFDDIVLHGKKDPDFQETDLVDLSPPVDLFDNTAVLDGAHDHIDDLLQGPQFGKATKVLDSPGTVTVIGPGRLNTEVQTEEEYLAIKNSVTIAEYAKRNGLYSTAVLMKILEWTADEKPSTRQVHIHTVLTPAEVDQLDLAFAQVDKKTTLQVSGSVWASRHKQPPFQPVPPTDLRGAVIDGAGQHWRRNRGSGLID